MLALPEKRAAVKICGITNREDALAAMEAGADLLGFNTWRGTRRFLDMSAAAPWIAELPVLRVALLVNAGADEARRVAQLDCVDALQLHGDEDADFCAALAREGKPLIKALRACDAAALDAADQFATREILLDAHVPGAFGGTGARVDGGLVREFQKRHPKLRLWLAGGLTPENVGEAVREFRPAAVDVSSGVEGAPGKKDFARMRDFVAAVRASG